MSILILQNATPHMISIELQMRVETLVELFRHIEKTRMIGIPVLNHALQIEAVGFEMLAAEKIHAGHAQICNSQIDFSEEVGGVGVLVTPWFMNLVWFPLRKTNYSEERGDKKLRKIGNTNFEFIAAYEPTFGRYEACSLFSPMFDFDNHSSAISTAQEILVSLRKIVSTSDKNIVKMRQTGVLERRSFLFGRKSATGNAV